MVNVLIISLLALYAISAIYYIVYVLIKYKGAISLKVASLLGFLLTSLTPFINFAFTFFVLFPFKPLPFRFLRIPIFAPSIFFFIAFFIKILALHRAGKPMERGTFYKTIISSFFVMIFASLVMLIAFAWYLLFGVHKGYGLFIQADSNY